MNNILPKLQKTGRKTKLKPGYLILSFIISCMLWVSVIAFLDPEETKTLNNIKLEFLYEETRLTSRNLVITEGRDTMMSVAVRGSRSNLAELSSENVRVVVDMSYATTGLRAYAYDVEFPDSLRDRVSVDWEHQRSRYADLRIDQLVNASPEVKFRREGPVAENYMLEDAVIEPAVVNIRGPNELVSQIAYAEVVLQRELYDKSIEHELLPFVFKTSDGQIIESALITSEVSAVSVSLPVVMTKQLPLKLLFEPGGGAAEKNVSYTVEPAAITVSGDKSELDKLNAIELGVVDLSKIDNTERLDFPIVIPNGLKNIDGLTEASVSLELNGLKERRFDLDADNVLIVGGNVPDGYRVEVVTKILPVRLRAAPEVIDLVSKENIQVMVDLRDYELTTSGGMFAVSTRVYCPAFPAVGALGNYSVMVDVVLDEDETTAR